MSTASQARSAADMDLRADANYAARQQHALQDLRGGLHAWRLAATLAWLDIRLRYRGSVLGPFWLTLSTGVMVVALGFLYSTLFQMDLHEYLPFLALSLVMWGFFSAVVADACTCFTSAEATIRAIRMPHTVHAGRVVVRNLLVLGHNLFIIVLVFVIFRIWPGVDGLAAVPGLVLWLLDSVAACLLLGTFCARFRDIPPIIANIMQIGFFVSPIIWKPEAVGAHGWWLPLNPFYSLMEVVRAPLLGGLAPTSAWVSALAYSAVLCVGGWLVFARVRSRLAFWV